MQRVGVVVEDVRAEVKLRRDEVRLGLFLEAGSTVARTRVIAAQRREIEVFLRINHAFSILCQSQKMPGTELCGAIKVGAVVIALVLVE